MVKELERDLGLYATITVSIGAMIGSGIFVLPGLGVKIAGPSIILAYFLAGTIVIPAALSKSEMATAMPKAGGTYLYIDRAIGPLPGTIAGIGVWFSLVFKSAFALVGLGAYLLLFIQLPQNTLPFIGLGIALILLAVNIKGVKQTGLLQTIIVSLVLISLFLFIINGITYVDQPKYHPFFGQGFNGLLAATGFVFVSYAGVTKIASVAEEVENPGRNIPVSILGSTILMMLIYTLVVFVIVGVSPLNELKQTLTPMSLAASSFLGTNGKIIIVVIATLALTSMANAGILSASRFPLAMSRDSLAPKKLGIVNQKFRTPIYSIAFTGAVLLVLIAFVPVFQLAKLASAFQILVFTFVNVALIAFRESNLSWYKPQFTSPAYPWIQLFGIGGGLILLTQLGPLSIAGALAIIVSGVVWYQIYGRARTKREGAALEAIRRSSAGHAIKRTQNACGKKEIKNILIPLGSQQLHYRKKQVNELVQIANDIAKIEGSKIKIVAFDEVPRQLDLSLAAERGPEDIEFEKKAHEIFKKIDLEELKFDEIVTHDTKRAIANYVESHNIDLVIGEWHPSRWRAELLGADVDWYMQNVKTDFVFIRNRGYKEVDKITVIADKGPFDPLEIIIADALAKSKNASINLIATLKSSAPDDKVVTAEKYLEELSKYCSSKTELKVLTHKDQIKGLLEASKSSRIVIVGTSAHNLIYDVIFGAIPDKLVEKLDNTILLIHSWRPRRHTFIKALFEKIIY